jgi:hypothetical protein
MNVKPPYTFPDSVKVAGVDIRVNWELASSDGDFGDYQQGRQLISLYLDKCNTERVAWDTLLHELNHAALDLGGVSYVLGDDKEEAVVRCHDGLLLATFRKIFRKYPKA